MELFTVAPSLGAVNVWALATHLIRDVSLLTCSEFEQPSFSYSTVGGEYSVLWPQTFNFLNHGKPSTWDSVEGLLWFRFSTYSVQ